MMVMLFPTVTLAQFNNNTTSPYSRFGLGDLQPKTFGRTAAMGGAALASRNSQQINTSNPASYTAVDSLVFLFEFGISGKFSNFSSNTGSINSNDFNFRYFAMNFQFTNWLASSLGITPFSDVGYNLSFSEAVENTGNVYHNYFGDGSISRVYYGLAFEPFNNISLGANLNYYFGKISKKGAVIFESSDQTNLEILDFTRLSDFALDFGAQATLPIKNDNLILAAVFEGSPVIKGFSADSVHAVEPNNPSTILDLIPGQTLPDFDEVPGEIQFPLTFGFGVSFLKENKLEINADYFHQAWSDASFFGESNQYLTNLNKFAFGAEWIPDKFSIRSYLNRIAYRAGLKYEKSYLMINDQQINDFGISFGVGLPLYRSNSTVNIAAEIGRKGTKKNNLLVENYAKLNLSVNLYDLWFIKRRFD